jgi:hypothetical protein
VQRAFEMLPNTCPFDVTGHPALQRALRMSDGLPVGMMLIGKHFDEASRSTAPATRSRSPGDWKRVGQAVLGDGRRSSDQVTRKLVEAVETSGVVVVVELRREAVLLVVRAVSLRRAGLPIGFTVAGQRRLRCSQ